MQAKAIVKVCLDAGMTVMLLFLMAYEMIGQAAHEWAGNWNIRVICDTPHLKQKMVG